MKCYRNISTDEVVYKEEAEEYVFSQLGDKITPLGKYGEMTPLQLEHIQGTIEWFFSTNWIEEEIKEAEEASVFELINEECEMENGRKQI